MLSCNFFIKSTIYSQKGNVKEIQTLESLTQGHKIAISGMTVMKTLTIITLKGTLAATKVSFYSQNQVHLITFCNNSRAQK